MEEDNEADEWIIMGPKGGPRGGGSWLNWPNSGRLWPDV